MQSNLLATLKKAGFATVGGLLLFSTCAVAQDLEELQSVTITGSLIPRSELALDATPIPVDILTSEDIAASGMSNAAELLQKMAVNNGGSVPVSNNATGFTPGASSVSLRGLGPETTLVLLNGRRLAPYPIGTGGTTAFVDLNSIPLPAIERIEVLKDGASATYGADAVAGVVNIVLKTDYVGMETSVRLGNTTKATDSSETILNMVTGISTEKTRITIGGNFYNREAIFARDRDYSAVPPFLSSNSSPVNIEVSREAALESLLNSGLSQAEAEARLPDAEILRTTSGPTLLGDPYGPGEYFDAFPGTETNNAGNDGTLPASAYAFYTSGFTNDSRFNYNLSAGSYPEMRRYGGFMAFEHEPFATDKVTFFGDFIYQNIYSRNELAPTATGNFFDPGSTPLVIPARTANPIPHPNEAVFFGGDRPAPDGAYNPFNPFNQDISWGTNIRLWDFGNRIYEAHNDAFNATLGIRVEDINDSTWAFEAAARYSKIERTFVTQQLSVSRFNRILNADDPIFDPESTEYIGTTVPFNPFGYYLNPIPNNLVVAQYAISNPKSYSFSDIASGDMRLTNTELFNMNAGPVGFAVGIDWRREEIEQSPDALGQAGDIMGSSPAATTAAARQIMGYFAEIELPLVSPDMDVPLIHSADISLAGRFEDFITSDRDTFVPKVAARWMPIDDSLLLRGTWQESYREPSLFQLFSGLSRGLLPLDNPRTGLQDQEVSVSSSGNPNLEAEEAESYSIGVVWTPEIDLLKGLSVAVDYWFIERKGVVDVDYDATIARAEAGESLPGESVLWNPDDSLLQVNAIFFNTAVYEVSGLDFEVGYVFPTENWGVFDARVVASYLDQYKYAFEEGDELFDYVGSSIGYANDGYLEWKGTISLQWLFKNWTVNINGNYTDGFTDYMYADIPGFDFSVVEFEVEDRLIWDVNVSYTLFGDSDKWFRDITITAGIDNILDEDPPYANDLLGNSSGYPDFLYTSENSFYWIEVKKKF
ncbi:MAG: TonB-dependent receptor domain-containing protein [Oceanipulchritudo sp.]